MESLSIMNVIYKVAKEITKAASGARQCKTKCQELASRVEVIAELVRESEAAPNDSATRRTVLERLRDNLEEALEVVQSCRSIAKLLVAGRSTISRIDNAERKINNCLLELGVANDVRLVPGNQKNTAAGRLAVHEGVVPATSIVVMNNSGIVTNINAKHSTVRSKQESSITYNISAGGSVNTYFGDSSSGNGSKQDLESSPPTTVVRPPTMYAVRSRRAEPFASRAQWRESQNVKIGSRWPGRAPAPEEGWSRPIRRTTLAPPKEDSAAAIHNNSSRVSASAGGSSRHLSVGDDSDYNGRQAGGECIQNHAAAPAPQMLSTARAASDIYRKPPSQGPTDWQHPYGGARDNAGVPYYYYQYSSVEEDPNSCSMM